MRRTLLSFLAAGLALLSLEAQAQYIWVNLSFKAVRNPANGQRYYAFDEADADASIAKANEWLAQYYRGYRFRRIDPIIEVGGIGDYSGPSKWYSVPPREGSNVVTMEAEAQANPVA